MASDADERVKRAVADKLDSGMRWLLRREIEQLPRLLPEDEEIELLAQGRLDEGTGMIVVTGRRLLFLEQGVSHRRVVDFPYREVESVQADVSVVSSDISVRGFDGEDPGHTLGRQPGVD